MQINDEWIEEMLSTLTPSVIECYNLDIHDKRACAIAAWNIMHPDEKIQDALSSEEILDMLVVKLYDALGTQLLFKGGYVLMKLFPDTARLSHDIDLSINDVSLYNDIIKILEQFANDLVAKGIASKFEIKDTIKPDMSGGIKIYKPSGELLVGADIGLHDTSYGYRTEILLDRKLLVFRFERMLSDKLSATLSRKRFRRPKDLYDIQLLLSNTDIDLTLVRDYMSKRVTEDDWKNYPFTETIIREYRKAYNSLVLVNHNNYDILNAPTFDVAFEIYNKLMYAIVTNTYTKWSFTEKRFLC